MPNNTETEGGDALIHLRVPRALKARWVQASRAASMTLTDWITSRLEQRPMNVFKVPQTGPLADKYHGAGLALAAISGGQLVALRYLRDAAPALADKIDCGGAHDEFLARQWLQTDEASAVVRELQALGEVHIGMLSCWEFCEL